MCSCVGRLQELQLHLDVLPATGEHRNLLADLHGENHPHMNDMHCPPIAAVSMTSRSCNSVIRVLVILAASEYVYYNRVGSDCSPLLLLR